MGFDFLLLVFVDVFVIFPLFVGVVLIFRRCLFGASVALMAIRFFGLLRFSVCVFFLGKLRAENNMPFDKTNVFQ